MEKSTCAVCQTPSKLQCSACKITYYCSRDCQKKDWKTHKQLCKKPTDSPAAPASQDKTEKLASSGSKEEVKKAAEKMIDQDNLISTESVGTFRWNDSIKLLPAPRKH